MQPAARNNGWRTGATLTTQGAPRVADRRWAGGAGLTRSGRQAGRRTGRFAPEVHHPDAKTCVAIKHLYSTEDLVRERL